MFLDFFDFFCNCIVQVFETMKKFVLFDNFSYFNLLIALLAIPIILRLIKFIMGIEDEEMYYQTTETYTPSYDHPKTPKISKSYKVYRNNPYHSKEAYKVSGYKGGN